MPDAKPTVCPNCYAILRGATCFKDESLRPQPGSVTICIDCAAVLVFTDSLDLRRPLAGEIDESDPELAKHVAAVKTLIQMERGGR